MTATLNQSQSSGAGLLKGENLYDVENVSVVHHLQQALKAHKLFQRDKDYIVRNGEVVIIDEFTGRMMPGRRYSEGLHQALEAKEKVSIQPENQTLASITFQNYFRLYDKLAGMTGTAETEAAELHEIYKLGVVPIPTNRPMVRADQSDLIYKTEEAKFIAVVDDVSERYEKGQPVLIDLSNAYRADEDHYLVIRYLDGRREHITGPVQAFFNSWKHERITVEAHRRHVATESQCLDVVYRSGRFERILGPSTVTFDPLEHEKIDVRALTHAFNRIRSTRS